MKKDKPQKRKVRGLFSLIFFLIGYTFHIIFKILGIIIGGITNRLRFSITFKITVSYVFLFSIVFSLMTTGIMSSYRYFVTNKPDIDFSIVLSGILLTANIAGIIIIIIIGAKASKRMLSPISRMTDTVKEISINALDKRLDVSGSKDELKDLARTFNEMLDRLQISVEQQNQFVSDASHELRTPISVIQGYANLLDRWGKDDPEVLTESIESIKSESDNMKNLVEKLLFLARGDKNTQKVEKQEFMLNELIDDIVKESQMIDNHHTIILDKNDMVSITADKNLIKEAIRILVDNSIKYTPEGGSITLSSFKAARKINIVVSDSGSGISKEDLPYIFNRFYRADKSRSKTSGGTGLGLSIAKWIVDHHSGRIFVQSELGIGTTFKIELPV